jgi:Ca-activated chloride channel family protein
MRLGWCLLLVALLWTATISGERTPQASAGKPTFKSRVDRVTVNAVVRDHKGRIVSDLSRKDFEVLDAGRPSPITDFRSDDAPVTIALLLDSSGSMRVASKLDDARSAADHVAAWLQPGDEIGLFSFDREFQEVRDFTRNNVSVPGGFDGVEAFGLTSLNDAIAETARRVSARGGTHRAVVVLTDGVDTSSHLTSAEVSGVASAIDVPVYIIAVLSPLDDPASSGTVMPKTALSGSLTDLAQWTGGELFVTSSPVQASLAARKIIDELRHQYLLAFEPGGNPGWHPLEVRARDRSLIVRARSGYFAGNS